MSVSRNLSFVAFVAVGFLATSAAGQQSSPPWANLPGVLPQQPPKEQANAQNEAFTPLAHVETRGTGPINVILIPGLNSDWSVFNDFMYRNVDFYTMHAVTLPGFGGSDAPPAPANGVYGLWLDNAQTAVWNWVTENGIENPVFVGHSFGGHLALRLAWEHGDDVRGAVTIDGGPAFPFGPSDQSPEDRFESIEQTASTFRSLTEDQWHAQLGQMAKLVVTDQDRADQFTKMWTAVPWDTSINYTLDFFASDISYEMSEVKCPTLAIAAIPDDVSANEAANIRNLWSAWFKNTPNATVSFFDGCRHYVMDDRPAKLDSTIEQFLSGDNFANVDDN